VPYGQAGEGVFTLYGTLAILRHAPHRREAETLFPLLWSPETERRLREMGAVDYALLERGKGREETPVHWSLPPDEVEAVLSESAALIRSHLE
jgi:hypothetical protein